MEAEAPSGGQVWASNHAGELLHHGSWSGPQEDPHVQNPTDRSKAKGGVAGDHIHAVAVEEQEAICGAI